MYISRRLPLCDTLCTLVDSLRCNTVVNDCTNRIRLDFLVESYTKYIAQNACRNENTERSVPLVKILQPQRHTEEIYLRLSTLFHHPKSMTLPPRRSADYGAIHSDLSMRSVPMDSSRSIEHVPDKYQPPFGAVSRKSSTTVGIVNILCTSLDGTALTIPYAMWKCGILCGTLILMGYAIGTALTLQFLCISARKLRAASYTEIVHRLFGQTFGLLFSGILFLVLFSILVGFLILMRQIGSDLLVLMTGATEIPPLLVMVVFSFLCLPFMLAESLHTLRYSCYLGFVSIILVLGCLMYAVTHPTTQYRAINFEHVKYMPNSLYDLLEALPVFTMLYISHFNVLGVFTQLENPTPHRMSQVICSSVLIMTALFVSFGIVGYFVFFTLLSGHAVDNILRAFPPHHRALLVGRLSLLVTLICTIPVMLIPARSILMEYYEDLLMYSHKQSADDTAVAQQIASVPAPTPPKRRTEPYAAAAGSIAPLSVHGGYSTWLDGTLFANRTHHADHVPPSPSSLYESIGTDNEIKEEDLEAPRQHHSTQIIPAPPAPAAGSSPTVISADEGDVGVGFEGVESHWRDWRALVAPLHSLDPHGRSAFQQELDEAESHARAVRLQRQARAEAQQAATTEHEREPDTEQLLDESKAMEETQGAVEMVSWPPRSSTTTTAFTAPTTTVGTLTWKYNLNIGLLQHIMECSAHHRHRIDTQMAVSSTAARRRGSTAAVARALLPHRGDTCAGVAHSLRGS